jgi:hypothetical protein
MRLFQCEKCGEVIYFENVLCGNCSTPVGYLAEQGKMVAIGSSGRLCANAVYASCNWIAAGDQEFCLACRHNRTIPDLSIPGNLANWQRYEQAKHRLFYTLVTLGLPTRSRAEDPEGGLAFDFLAETKSEPHVVTGHDHGLITLNLREADDAERARERHRLGEPYRTLLGHLRHESGHYFWTQLVTDAKLEAFREIFGDERRDYAAALQQHYAKDPSRATEPAFISTYAESHPWEDFAETWAHYLHIVDTMEMASTFGTSVRPRLKNAAELNVAAHCAPKTTAGFHQFIDEWLALTVFMNSLNRCMGAEDLYPFILLPPVIAKLEFIHSLVTGAVVNPVTSSRNAHEER